MLGLFHTRGLDRAALIRASLIAPGAVTPTGAVGQRARLFRHRPRPLIVLPPFVPSLRGGIIYPLETPPSVLFLSPFLSSPSSLSASPSLPPSHRFISSLHFFSGCVITSCPHREFPSFFSILLLDFYYTSLSFGVSGSCLLTFFFLPLTGHSSYRPFLDYFPFSFLFRLSIPYFYY